MGLLKKFFNQTRKPEGFLGKMMIKGMNIEHARIADWGMSNLTIGSPEEILEIGCGGGRNAGELLKKFPKAKLTAIDYSDVSLEEAKIYNAEALKIGRCTVQKGDVSDLQLPGEQYDLATAFETIYFWPGLESCFLQVAKILKPGGIFMIVNESDGNDKATLQFEKIIDGMECYTIDQIEAALKSAGFSEVRADHHQSKPWITVLAKK